MYRNLRPDQTAENEARPYTNSIKDKYELLEHPDNKLPESSGKNLIWQTGLPDQHRLGRFC